MTGSGAGVGGGARPDTVPLSGGRRPDTVPLTGADCFLRAFDREIRHYHGASHVSQLVLRLGPGFDADRLRKLVGEVARAQPLVRAPIARRLGVGPPVYRLCDAGDAPLPPVEVYDVEAQAPEPDGPLPEVFSARLNERLRPERGELLRFDVVRYRGGAAGTDLAMSWLHMLFDGSGSERFVRWLDECFRGERGVSELPEPDEFAPLAQPSAGLGERGDRARAWQRWVEGLASPPLHSLAGPLRRTPQDLGIESLQLTGSETTAALEAARSRAGFLTPMLFFLAAAIRTHDAVFRARRQDPGSYVVPLPVNVRPRGREGAIFRTHVSLLWFRVLPQEVEDLDGLLALLKQQRLAAIKAGHVESGSVAMDFARFAPSGLYTRQARRHHAGELCSFFFAWTGDFLPGLERFLGAEVRTGFHVPPVPPSPGSCLAMSVNSGHLNATHVFQRDVLGPEEREIFRARLRADLAG